MNSPNSEAGERERHLNLSSQTAAKPHTTSDPRVLPTADDPCLIDDEVDADAQAHDDRPPRYADALRAPAEIFVR